MPDLVTSEELVRIVYGDGEGDAYSEELDDAFVCCTRR